MMTILLVMALFFTMAIPVFATDETGPFASGDAEDPAKAAITKILKMPIGTSTPETDFTFVFDKISLDDEKSENTKKTMPAISIVAEIKAGNAGNTPQGSGIKTVISETGSIFESKNMDKAWPRAGVYVYNVSEKKNTFIGAPGESMTYSGAVYEFTVYVDNSPSGLYVAAIVVKILTNDASNSGSIAKTKVDPTPGGDPEDAGGYSGVIFTNTFLRNQGGSDPADKDNAVLTVSKEVTGLASDQTKYFPFIVTVFNPETIDEEDLTYTAYVLNEKDENVTGILNTFPQFLGNDDEYGDYVILDAGQKRYLHLAHGQRLVFIDLPVGSSFIVEEMATPKFTPEFVLTLNGNSGDAVTGTENSSITTDKQFVTEGTDKAAFTNMYRKVTPMGISVNNLPYYIVIVLSLIFLTVFLTVKYHKSATRKKQVDE